ncbi:Ras suppressor protein 1 [Porphyridium purpureum]|uniref:Ras suppressor protein 1 n=1 Tax=Porphyridium purpureum TaxID=35688 RepID=A0A5J4YTE2_PORPP|nr:Ras suppressor protein 1 [Porphyridium purpureum]|eukprot:POR4162..scf236_6
MDGGAAQGQRWVCATVRKHGDAAGKMGDKRAQFFDAIRDEKLQTIRWSLRHGGMTPTNPFSDDDLPPLHVAVQLGKLKSLRTLLEHVDRTRDQATVDVPDATHANRTPLMLAAAGGWEDGCRVLLKSGASLSVKDDKGRTALEYAQIKKRAKIVRLFEEALREPESADEAEMDPEVRKQQKLEREAEDRGISVGKLVEEKQAQQQVAESSRVEQDIQEYKQEQLLSQVKNTAAWDEIQRAAAERYHDLSVPEGRHNELDSTLWLCGWLKTLTISGLGAELGALPRDVFQLSSLTELTLRNCGISSLPEDFGDKMPQLKVLDLEGNALETLPRSLGKLDALEVVNLNRNALRSVAALEGCSSLVTFKVAYNQLEALDLDFAKMPRLQLVGVEGNRLAALPAELGDLQNLQELNIADNQLVELPPELGNLNVKKFQTIELRGNPLRDKKIDRIMDKGAKPMKELLAHLKKQQSSSARKGGGKKKKGKTGAGNAAREESEDDQSE